MPGKVIISNSTDPYTNLAMEDLLFRDHVSKECPNILFLYQNKPSVIIGRAQNPWLEANLPYLEKNDINIIRRQSGGGTVYHDLGNLNYCFLALNDYYLVDQHLRIITQALEDLEIKSNVNKRNDIIIKTNNNVDKKISGSAFRTSKDRSFHHATLLINSNIDNLIKSISSTHKIINAKGVQSIRSSVMNIKEINPYINISNIIKKISDRYMLLHDISDINDLNDINDISDIIKNNNTPIITSEKWLFEKTLGFNISIPLDIKPLNINKENPNNSEILCHVNHGIIKEFFIKDNKRVNNNKDIKIIIKTLNKHCTNIPLYKNIPSSIKLKIKNLYPNLNFLFHTIFLYLNKYCYTAKKKIL